MSDATKVDNPSTRDQILPAEYIGQSEDVHAASEHAASDVGGRVESLPDSQVDAVLAELDRALRQDSSQSVRQLNLRPTARQKEGVRRVLAFLDTAKPTSEPGVATKVVARLLDQHVAKQPLPPLIVGFLEQHWRFYLVRLCVAEGEEGPGWHNAIEHTNKLLWSLQPKKDSASRKRALGLLLELFQWIHTILESQYVPISDEDTFFAGLAQLYAATLYPEKPLTTLRGQCVSDGP